MEKLKIRIGLAVFLLIMLLSPCAFSLQINPLPHFKNNPDGSQTLLDHVPQEVVLGAAQKISHANPGQMLELRVILPSKDPAGLENFIKALQDPKNPLYHHFLNPSQFAQQFGASSINSQLVIEYLRSKGMTVKGQSDNGFILTVDGQVSAVENAFKVTINNYKKANGAMGYAAENDPTIPAQMAGRVNTVIGMDNFVRFFPHFHRGNPLKPTSVLKPSNNLSPEQGKTLGARAFLGYGGTLGPTDIKTAYNLSGVASTGANQNLAVYELDGYLASDVTTFENYYSLPNMTLTNVYTDGATGVPGSGTDEVVLDIDLALAVAQGLNSILVYEAPDTSSGWIDQWDKIASDDLAKIISVSWGADEAETFASYSHSIFAELAAQGQTVFASAGDSGAYDNCDPGTLPPNCKVSGNPAAGALSVDDPASDPNITGVGISLLTINGDGSYNNETGSLYGGGGVSSYVSIPAYQTSLAASAVSAAQVSTSVRNVPDVVFTADPATSYGIYVTDPTQGPDWYGVWGSSAAAPIWAAFAARVNQGRLAAGISVLGALNPMIYQIGQSSRYSSDFHDITSGNNSYYPAEAGFDDATGLGSFNGLNLYNDLIGPAAPAGLTATAGNTQVVLAWSAASTAVSYNVKRATVSGGPYTTVSTSGSVTSTSYTDTSLSNGTPYYYVVSAVNIPGIEGVNSAEAHATPLGITVPSPPTAVSAVAGSAQAAITFSGAQPNGHPITSYTVTSTPGAFNNTGASSPIIVAGLTNGTSYTFTVTAANSVGTGASSIASNSIIAGSPAPPTTVSASAGNGQATVTFSGAAANASSITGYTAASSPGGLTGSGTSSPVTVSGLKNGTLYSFSVTATNSFGASAPSSASNSITPAGSPLPPTSVTALAGNAEAIVIFSGALSNGSPITSYTATSSPGGLTGTALSSPITVTGLTNDANYTFTVIASNAVGQSAASVASNSVTPSPIYPPSALNVKILAARAAGRIIYGGNSLSWAQSQSPGIIQNRVYRAIGTGPFSAIATFSASTSYSDQRVSLGTVYNYKVTALDSNGNESAGSNVVTVNY